MVDRSQTRMAILAFLLAIGVQGCASKGPDGFDTIAPGTPDADGSTPAITDDASQDAFPEAETLSLDAAPAGCRTNADCAGYSTPGAGHALGAVCLKATGACDALGLCAGSPSCDPGSGSVCGCDGVTYASLCDLLAAGVNELNSLPCE